MTLASSVGFSCFFFFDLITVNNILHIYGMKCVCLKYRKCRGAQGGKREWKTRGEVDTQTRDFLRYSRTLCQILRVN